MFRLLGLQLASNNFPRYQGTPSHRPGCHLVLRKARAFVVELDAFLGTSRFWRARARSSAWTCSVRPHLSGWNGINPYPSPRCMRLKWISLQGTWNYSICCAPPWVECFHTILRPWYWTMLCPSSRAASGYGRVWSGRLTSFMGNPQKLVDCNPRTANEKSGVRTEMIGF